MKMPTKTYPSMLLIGALSASSLSAAVVARFDLGDPQDLAVAPVGEIQWADVNSSNFDDPVSSNGVTLTITGTLQGWRQRSFTADPGANYAVVRDFVFTDSADTVTFTFAGLTANEEYFINFWSFDTGGNANSQATWSVAGGSSISGVHFTGSNAQQSPYLLTGTADGVGSLEMSVSGANWRLNGAEISVIPEPSTALLGGLGLLALLRRRR